ncbi:uncharacterized protein L969DRAFT_96972 [Mixia osmundae IAM 14324]|uniref:Metal homeostatis protein bsd2 n=1 Tax=Mixia osmundae (strain CBS 9802 / IAM 14324 / JCM 22182 / KY 12970) TaxID=764103 RepID=G7E2N3_MIXOS|nr:uncharacterized protein L969DRAFT_96972 [Mixia osmundae IAM 14324]KEI36958.1 hypothetical protein L969DRAFT_96972 [Mixia osmundae IAM 14324]GAA97093.1 hypothetical protein E5Q_03768 [Mixia osmundae IAM 14324]
MWRAVTSARRVLAGAQDDGRPSWNNTASSAQHPSTSYDRSRQRPFGAAVATAASRLTSRDDELDAAFDNEADGEASMILQQPYDRPPRHSSDSLHGDGDGNEHDADIDDDDDDARDDDQDDEARPLRSQAHRQLPGYVDSGIALSTVSSTRRAPTSITRSDRRPPGTYHPVGSTAEDHSDLPVPVTQPTALAGSRMRAWRHRLLPSSLLHPGAPSIHTSHSGPGSGNDGVFANLNAKPEMRRGEHGQLEFVGGDDEGAGKEVPPSYEAASADTTPPYWETTVIAPSGYLSGSDDVLVDGLPVGNFFAFAWNLLVSMSFQFIGFLLTYLLHTSHAAKNGSRAGLGITMIQYALYLRSRAAMIARGELDNEIIGPGYDPAGQNSTTAAAMSTYGSGWGLFGTPVMSDTNASLQEDDGSLAAATTRRQSRGGLPPANSSLFADGRLGRNLTLIGEQDQLDPEARQGIIKMAGAANDYLSYVLLLIGWILVLGSFINYYKAVRYARAIRDSEINARANANILFDATVAPRAWGLRRQGFNNNTKERSN